MARQLPCSPRTPHCPPRRPSFLPTWLFAQPPRRQSCPQPSPAQRSPAQPSQCPAPTHRHTRGEAQQWARRGVRRGMQGCGDAWSEQLAARSEAGRGAISRPVPPRTARMAPHRLRPGALPAQHLPSNDAQGPDAMEAACGRGGAGSWPVLCARVGVEWDALSHRPSAAAAGVVLMAHLPDLLRDRAPSPHTRTRRRSSLAARQP